jgi:hypothetical protein
VTPLPDTNASPTLTPRRFEPEPPDEGTSAEHDYAIANRNRIASLYNRPSTTVTGEPTNAD